jgi:hypothetical protein
LYNVDAPPPKIELVNMGGGASMGYAGVINTAAAPPYLDPTVWSRPAGAVERLLVILPLLLAAIFVVSGTPMYAPG